MMRWITFVVDILCIVQYSAKVQNKNETRLLFTKDSVKSPKEVG